MWLGTTQGLMRVDASAPIRYLTQDEVAAVSSTAAYRYRDLANTSH
jgi:hypothetical protein